MLWSAADSLVPFSPNQQQHLRGNRGGEGEEKEEDVWKLGGREVEGETLCSLLLVDLKYLLFRCLLPRDIQKFSGTLPPSTTPGEDKQQMHQLVWICFSISKTIYLLHYFC